MCFESDTYHTKCGHWGRPMTDFCNFRQYRSGCYYNQRSGIKRFDTLCIGCKYRASVATGSFFTFRSEQGEVMEFTREVCRSKVSDRALQWELYIQFILYSVWVPNTILSWAEISNLDTTLPCPVPSILCRAKGVGREIAMFRTFKMTRESRS